MTNQDQSFPSGVATNCVNIEFGQTHSDALEHVVIIKTIRTNEALGRPADRFKHYAV